MSEQSQRAVLTADPSGCGDRILEVLHFLDSHSIGYTLYTHPPLYTIEEALKYWDGIESTHCKNLFSETTRGTGIISW